METKIEIKSIYGKVLFEYEKENNTIKDTVIMAIKCCANLSGANLHNANLSGASLNGANLSGASLHNANLSGANLNGANLSGASLINANLSGASLIGTYLVNTYLNNANLCDAGLYEAYLLDADLKYASLCGADLKYADLRGSDLRNADLCGVKNFFIPTYLPEGEFIAWKKLPNGLIVKLKILEDSKRSRGTGSKCRCDKALVLEFQNKDRSKPDLIEYTSHKYATCTYKVGEIVYADSWDDNRWNECSHGIHFFIDRQSAVDY